MKETDSINEFKHVIKTLLGNLICAHAGLVKFIYKISDIFSQQKKQKKKKKNINVYKNTYMSRKIRIS